MREFHRLLTNTTTAELGPARLFEFYTKLYVCFNFVQFHHLISAVSAVVVVLSFRNSSVFHALPRENGNETTNNGGQL